MYQIVFKTFPIDYRAGTLVSLLSAIAMPSISNLLFETERFEKNGKNRLDYLGNAIRTVVVSGHESFEAQVVFERLNLAHSQYSVSNDEFLFTLGALIFEPIWWINQYGWRRLTALEEETIFRFWVKWGENMNLTDIPQDFSNFQGWYVESIRNHHRFSETNHAVANSVMKWECARLPFPARFLALRLFFVMIPKSLLLSLGFSQPHFSFRVIAEILMKGRNFMLRNLASWNYFEKRLVKPAVN